MSDNDPAHDFFAGCTDPDLAFAGRVTRAWSGRTLSEVVADLNNIRGEVVTAIELAP